MKYFSNIALAGLAGALAGGCAGNGDTGKGSDPRGRFELVVAPWEIDSDADYACYDISVTDADGAIVWADDEICTDDFSLGATGVLGYVGLCEAGPTGQATNHVRISLTRLVADDGTELGNWGDSPPTFEDDFVCNADADAVVRAAFVVLTAGTKGFLDVSVRVDEIECNAKIDCRDDFLSTGDDTADEGTLVVALACGATDLCMDDLRLVCLDALDEEVVVTVDPSAGPGVHAGYPNAFVFGVMSSQGVSTDGQTTFWTVSIGITSGWHDCHISARMTASHDGDFGENSVYPVIVGDEVPFSFGADGTFVCAHPLDGVGSGFHTDWDEEFGCDNCLEPDLSTPDDVTDVSVGEECGGDPDPQDECPPGQVDPDLDGVCECPAGQSDPDDDDVCTPIPCPVGQSDPDGDGVCTPIPCPEGQSDPDGDGVCTPTPDDGCTYSQGYWKTHHEGANNPSQAIDWPAPEDESTLLCGVTWYATISAQGGGAWKQLSKQWIAARLNVASGAPAPPEVTLALAEAEAILTTSCAGLSAADTVTAVALASTLEAYNTGETGPGHCD